MKLKILLPTEVFLDREVNKVIAEAENGSFCLLPRHVDFVAVLVPGILCFGIDQEKEEFLAVDEGVLVKCGDDVMVSVRNAVRGPELGELRRTIEQQFEALSEQEKKAKTALAKLESDFFQQFLNLEKRYG